MAEAQSAATAGIAGALPAGTVTFLFTDITGSTARWEQHPQAMRAALARHDALLQEGIAAYGGVVLTERGARRQLLQRAKVQELVSLTHQLLLFGALHRGVMPQSMTSAPRGILTAQERRTRAQQ